MQPADADHERELEGLDQEYKGQKALYDDALSREAAGSVLRGLHRETVDNFPDYEKTYQRTKNAGMNFNRTLGQVLISPPIHIHPLRKCLVDWALIRLDTTRKPGQNGNKVRSVPLAVLLINNNFQLFLCNLAIRDYQAFTMTSDGRRAVKPGQAWEWIDFDTSITSVHFSEDKVVPCASSYAAVRLDGGPGIAVK